MNPYDQTVLDNVSNSDTDRNADISSHNSHNATTTILSECPHHSSQLKSGISSGICIRTHSIICTKLYSSISFKLRYAMPIKIEEYRG
jgi:hypothetical protein